MTLPKWAQEARKRAAAATEGPWTIYAIRNISTGTEIRALANWPHEDKLFIAHARTDLPCALTALEAALSVIECWEARHEGDPDSYTRWLRKRATLTALLADENEKEGT